MPMFARSLRFALPVAVVIGTALAAPVSARAGDGAIVALVGNWSGNAQATLDSGQTETMRCKGYYTGQGPDGLGIAIRCANASSKIDLRATLTFDNGAVSGNWEERTYNAAGSVSGKSSPNKVNLAITGGGLTAAMAVNITGASHSVSISTQGTGLKGVNISFNRG
ncbi:MAG: hypothetical protein ABL901_01870 [Hyphomicrobiaceae bacterium]